MKVAVSNRHVHLCLKDKNILFGEDYEFKVLRPLSQTGQFTYQETVDIITEKGTIKNVRVLGPLRNYTQLELSRSDSISLGINPPLRDSGDLSDSECVKIIGPNGEVLASNSTIIAHRHIHMNSTDACNYGVINNSIVSVKVPKERGGVFENVHIKVDDSYILEMHIDRDEANAFDIKNNDEVYIIK